MKTYNQPPPWPNDPQQWDTRHDIRRFLEDAIVHSNALLLTIEELECLNVVSKDRREEVENLSIELERIYNGEEEV